MYKDNQCWFGGPEVHYQCEAVCQVCGGPQWSGGTYWHWRRDESWVRFLRTVNTHLSLKIPCHIHILDFLLNERTGCCGIPWDNLVEFYSWTSFLLHPLSDLSLSSFSPPPLWLFMNDFKCHNQSKCRGWELSFPVYLRLHVVGGGSTCCRIVKIELV